MSGDSPGEGEGRRQGVMRAGQATLVGLVGVARDLHVGEQAHAGHEHGEGGDHPVVETLRRSRVMITRPISLNRV